MIIIGKEYDVRDKGERKTARRRVIYSVGNKEATPEQKKAIERLEQGLQTDCEGIADPYDLMRRVEFLGVSFQEQELRSDGKWYPLEDPDIGISLMQEGAL